jgi:hypothetical protein
MKAAAPAVLQFKRVYGKKKNLLSSGLKYKPAILDRKLEYAAMFFYNMSHAFCAKTMPLFF